MAWFHPDAEEYRRQRWMRGDAERWLKPDPERWLSPEELRLQYPQLYERKYVRTPPFDRRAWFLRTRGAAKDLGPARAAVDHPLDDPEVSASSRRSSSISCACSTGARPTTPINRASRAAIRMAGNGRELPVVPGRRSGEGPED
jgi:hypothetical protein